MAHIEETTIGGAIQLRVSGELDLTTAPDLSCDLLDALDQSDVVEVDLREVTFIDSSGLRALISALTDGHPGHQMVLTGVSSPVRRLLDLTGLSSTFGLDSDVA